MPPRRRLASIAFGFLGALFCSIASADAVEDAARAAGEVAISRQIEAFRSGDAAEAYSYASPGIQGLFAGPEGFMAMVRNGYAPVIGPRRFEFGPVRDGEDGGIEQAVRLLDADGVEWDALYSLERQPDGSWKISGCRLVKRPGESA